MSIAKRALGNSGRYYETFKKYLPGFKMTPTPTEKYLKDIAKSIHMIEVGLKVLNGFLKENGVSLVILPKAKEEKEKTDD